MPSYYGYYTAQCGTPAAATVAGRRGSSWSRRLSPGSWSRISLSEMRELPEARRDLLVNDIENVVKEGNITRDAYSECPGSRRALPAPARAERGGPGGCRAVARATGGTYALRRIRVDLRARNRVEVVIRKSPITSSMIAIFTTIGIVLSVLFEAIRFFQEVPITEFLSA